MNYAVVVPSLGRRSLQVLLDSLGGAVGPPPDLVVVVDDRPLERASLEVWVPGRLEYRLRILRCGGRGPAAARNVGWRATCSPWVVFVDDDVLVPRDWPERLVADLGGLGADVGGSQARVRVPLPGTRRPTDAERSTAALSTARWITAEMAYRREVLVHLDGFDERFTRAYREDADLALRALADGYRLVVGEREVVHPTRRTDRWHSVRVQVGNADDPLMDRKHGTRWRQKVEADRGRRRWHLVTVAAGVAAPTAAVTGYLPVAAGAAAAWLALTGWFAWQRIAPGPRTPTEVGTMLVTSVAIPPVATWHWLRGLWRYRRVPRWRPPPRVVLFDRDGTLVHDVPYNAEPARVLPVDGAREALDRLRARGIRLGVVSNQSGIGRRVLSPSDVDAVNARVAELLGPFDIWEVCPHLPGDGCGCRKPAPGLIHKALADLGLSASECAVVGDIGSDVAAALAAGARPVLVPTPVTRAEEVRAAPEVAADLRTAVDLLVGTVPPGAARARVGRSGRGGRFRRLASRRATLRRATPRHATVRRRAGRHTVTRHGKAGRP